MVAETFRLRINIIGSLTVGASKAPPSASCDTLWVSLYLILFGINGNMKKTLISILFILLVTNCLFGQSNWQEIDNFHDSLARIKMNGKYGFINKAGKTVISFKYNYASEFENGLSNITTNATGYIDDPDKHLVKAYIDTTGRIVWISHIQGTDGFFNDYREGLYYTSLGGKFGYVDRFGNVVVPFIYDYKSIGERVGPYGFSEGLAGVALNDKLGFVDKKGNLVIPCIYDDALGFSEGLAAVSKNGLWGFINKDGKEVIPIKYYYVGSFHDGLSMVSSNKSFCNNEKYWCPAIQYGFINKSGQTIYSEEYITYVQSGKAVEIEDSFNNFKDSLCIVMNNKQEYFILNTNGVKTPINNKNIAIGDSWLTWSTNTFSEGLCKIHTTTYPYKYGFINKNSDLIIPCLYDEAASFQEGLTSVKLDNKWGLIDSIGRLIISFEYDGAIIFSEGLAAVQKNGKKYFIDKKGDCILGCR